MSNVIPAWIASRSASSASAGTSSTWRIRIRVSGIGSAGRLVEKKPVEPDLVHGLEEFVRVHGLHDVAVRAEVIARHEVSLLARRGQDDDGDHFRPLVRLDAPEHLEPVHLRELEVEEDDSGERRPGAGGISPFSEEKLEGLGSVADDMNVVRDVGLLQRAQGQLGVVGVVLDEQDVAVSRSTHEEPPGRGRLNEKVAPSPTLPSAHTSPPCRWTMRWTSASPTPVPSNSWLEWSRWKTPKSLFT